jgi:hypothetical protein
MGAGRSSNCHAKARIVLYYHIYIKQGRSTVKQSVRKRRGRISKRSIKKITWGRRRIK